MCYLSHDLMSTGPGMQDLIDTNSAISHLPTHFILLMTLLTTYVLKFWCKSGSSSSAAAAAPSPYVSVQQHSRLLFYGEKKIYAVNSNFTVLKFQFGLYDISGRQCKPKWYWSQCTCVKYTLRKQKKKWNDKQKVLLLIVDWFCPILRCILRLLVCHVSFQSL